MKVFISQPFHNKTEEEIIRTRVDCVNECFEKFGTDITILSSFFKGISNEHNSLWWLAKSIELLSEADVAVFAGDWENYRGCQIEHMCAEKYEIPIEYL